VLGAVRLIELDESTSRAAGELPPPALRTLDSIHVAAALAIGDECEVFICYDDRLKAAATQAGLQVVAPA
jgi:hypothetical protein